MTWKMATIFFAAISTTLMIILGCYLHANRHAIITPSNGIEYKDLLALILTALGVMIGLLTVFLAVAAVWGYTALKDGAHKMAAGEARKVAEEVAKRTVLEFQDQTPRTKISGDDYGQAAGDES